MTHAVHVEHCLSLKDVDVKPKGRLKHPVKVAIVTFSDGSTKELSVKEGEIFKKEIAVRKERENGLFFISESKAINLNHIISFNSAPSQDREGLINCRIGTTQEVIEVKLSAEEHQKFRHQLKLRAANE